MAAWRSRTGCWARGWRCGTGSASATAGRCSATRSASCPRTARRTCVVRTRRGPVRVRRSAVVAVRAVPPAPARRASLAAVARLEGLCADAWPALVERRLGAWRLRAAGRVHRPGQRRAGHRRPGPADPGGAARRARVRRRARDPGAGAHAGRLAVGPGGGRAGLDAGGRPRGRSGQRGAGGAARGVRRSPGRAVRAAAARTGGGSAPAIPRPPRSARVIAPPGRCARRSRWSTTRDGVPVGHLRAAVVDDHLHLALLAVAPVEHGLAGLIRASRHVLATRDVPLQALPRPPADGAGAHRRERRPRRGLPLPPPRRPRRGDPGERRQAAARSSRA